MSQNTESVSLETPLAEKPPYAENSKYLEMQEYYKRNNFSRIFFALDRIVERHGELFDHEFHRQFRIFQAIFDSQDTLTGEDYYQFPLKVMEPFWDQLYKVEAMRPEVYFA